MYPAVEEDTSPDVLDGTCSNSTKSVICIQLYKEATSHYLKMAMLPIPPRQLQLMGLMVQQQKEDAAALVVSCIRGEDGADRDVIGLDHGLLED